MFATKRWATGLWAMTLFAGVATEARAATEAEQKADRTVRSAKREGANAADEARSEAVDMGHRMGRLESHDIKHTATLDLAGVVFGEGINGQYVRANRDHVSTVLGANYSRTDGVNGSITKIGAEAGIDYFLLGRRNEGLRIGPRLVGSVGVDTTGGSSGFGDIGAGAELGYNFISRAGVTAGAAAGWDLLFRGSLGGNNNGDIDGHPYGKLNIGYSW